MVRITRGFKLFQPWANEIVRGNLLFLIRSFPARQRKSVAVIASNNIDKIWLKNASNKEILELANKVGVIGSIEIKDCIKVDLDKVESELIRLAGEKYLRYYPKHLIPSYTRNRKAFIWILDNPKEWKKPKHVNGGGITWAKLNLIGE